MFEWKHVNTNKISRIGYNKEVQSLFIDFIGSLTDTAYLNVPEPLFRSFIESKSPDDFYENFIEGYFEVASQE